MSETASRSANDPPATAVPDLSADADPRAATRAADESAAVFDLPDRTQLELTGPDRHSFLHGFCTNDVRGLAEGQVGEAFLCNVKGRVLGHVLIAALPDSLWLDTAPGQAERLMTHLERYHLLEDFRLTDRSSERADLLISGPRAVEPLRTSGLLEEELTPRTVVERPVDAAGASLPVRIARVDLFGPPGFLISVPAAARPELLDRLVRAGAVPGPRAVFESLRIEAAWPESGRDLTDEHLAQEADRTAQAISFTKGCYLGQEPIARIHALGHVNRVLRCVVIEGTVIPEPGTPLVDPAQPDREVGRISSAAWSWRFDRPVALATVRTQWSRHGADLLTGDPLRAPARVMRR